MAHHKHWGMRWGSTMKELGATGGGSPSTPSDAGMQGQLDSRELTVKSGSKEQGVNRATKGTWKKTGGPQ